MARNRYGWEKRAKEMARKQKNEEKMRRRQGKLPANPAAEESSGVEESITTGTEAEAHQD